MKCHQVQKRLSVFQDGELNPREKGRVSEHLERCSACRERYAEMEKVWQSLGDLKEVLPEPGFYGQVVKKINESSENRLAEGLQWFSQFFSSPWAASTLLIAGILIGTFLGNFLAGGALIPIRTEIASRAPQPVEVSSLSVFDALPPGTLGETYIRLAGSTEVHYR